MKWYNLNKKMATIATAAILSTTLSTTAYADTYTIKPGDTLTGIAKKYNTSVTNLKTLNGLASDRIYANQPLTVLDGTVAGTTTQTITPAPATSIVFNTYTVVSGDTLIKIANQHGISLAELKIWNNIESHIIYPGQVFTVSKPNGSSAPAPTTTANTDQTTTTVSNANTSNYVIKSGDTLSRIALDHGMTVSTLKSLNNLTSDLIFAGQTLKVSGSSAGSTPALTANVSSNPTPTNVQASTSLIDVAKSLVGIPYAWGGNTPAGFDCSGFIYYVHNRAGIEMNRYSAQGYYDRSYYVSNPQAGDLVFFENTYKSGISHMGIYLGNNQFVHAGSDGVEISSLGSGYWQDHFVDFKRFY